LIGDARSCVAKRRPKTPPPFGPGVENEGSEIVAGPIAQAGTSKSSQGLHESVGQRGVGGAGGARWSGARARARGRKATVARRAPGRAATGPRAHAEGPWAIGRACPRGGAWGAPAGARARRAALGCAWGAGSSVPARAG